VEIDPTHPAAVAPNPLGAPRRSHPAAIAVEALRSLREMAIPLIIAVVLGAGASNPTRALMYGAIGLVIVVITGLARWWTTMWSLDDQALHLRTGLLSRDEKVIPRARISSLDTVQGPLQRLFGVLELRVQTPGGGRDAEIVLRAVARRDAETLRRALGHAAERAVTPDARMRLGTGQLVVAALTSPQITVLVPVLGGIAAAGQDLVGDVDVTSSTLDGLPHSVLGWLLIVAGVVALAWLLSFAGAVVAFSGFEVLRDGDRLRIRSGLLARRAATLPLNRVQGIRVVEGLLREPFGLASLRVETAGYAGQGAVTQTLFPLVRRRDVPAVLDRLVPALAGQLEPLEPPPPRARRSYLAMPLAVAVVLSAAIALVLGDAWPAIPVVLGLAAAIGLLRHRAAGWRLDGDRVVLRSRHVARTTLIADKRRLQEHGTRETPLQRRRRLADVTVAVGSRHRAGVRHLEAATAQRLLGLLRS
jgi:putative membrane protein